MNTQLDPTTIFQGVVGYSFQALLKNLEPIRRQYSNEKYKTLPASTLHYWMKELEITPEKYNLYTELDQKILEGLIIWLSMSGSNTIQQYKEILEKKGL